MKSYVLLNIFLSSLFLPCCTLFDYKENKAIEICQKAKENLQLLNINTTWLDYANQLAKNNPNDKYDWRAKKTSEENIYLVAFLNQNGWGYHWEVDITQNIVKEINSNDYLSEKYGYKTVDTTAFPIQKIQQLDMYIEYQNGDNYSKMENVDGFQFYDRKKNKTGLKVGEIIKATLINKTDKTIISAEVTGQLRLIFKEKTVTGESYDKTNFGEVISESNPWQPNTTKEFYIKTKGIDNLYLNYIPEYVLFNVSLIAQDPTGYLFDKDVAEYDVKEHWNTLRSYKRK